MARYKLRKIEIEEEKLPIKKYDDNSNLIYYKDSNGFEYWKEYDDNDNLIHSKNSNGDEVWKDDKGNRITKEEFNKIWEKIEE